MVSKAEEMISRAKLLFEEGALHEVEALCRQALPEIYDREIHFTFKPQ